MKDYDYGDYGSNGLQTIVHCLPVSSLSSRYP